LLSKPVEEEVKRVRVAERANSYPKKWRDMARAIRRTEVEEGDRREEVCRVLAEVPPRSVSAASGERVQGAGVGRAAVTSAVEANDDCRRVLAQQAAAKGGRREFRAAKQSSSL
jgi:hypothetical protein